MLPLRGAYRSPLDLLHSDLILTVSMAYIDRTVLFRYPSIYILGNACTLNQRMRMVFLCQ
jgi:hypothetical protein